MWQCVGERQHFRQPLASQLVAFARSRRIQGDVVAKPTCVNQPCKCVNRWRAPPRLVFNNRRRRSVRPTRQLTLRNALAHPSLRNDVCPSHIHSIQRVLSDQITPKPTLPRVPKQRPVLDTQSTACVTLRPMPPTDSPPNFLRPLSLDGPAPHTSGQSTNPKGFIYECHQQSRSHKYRSCCG